MRVAAKNQVSGFLEDVMLKRLKRGYTSRDIQNAAQYCRDEGIAVMFDLLIGAPGETFDGIGKTIDLMKLCQPDRVGISLGLRVYPGTELCEAFDRGELEGGLSGGPTPFEPLFFLEPGIAEGVSAFLDEQTAGDSRFLFFNPDKPQSNYNYNANQRLVDGIRDGHRGAYWDILRKMES